MQPGVNRPGRKRHDPAAWRCRSDDVANRLWRDRAGGVREGAADHRCIAELPLPAMGERYSQQCEAQNKNRSWQRQWDGRVTSWTASRCREADPTENREKCNCDENVRLLAQERFGPHKSGALMIQAQFRGYDSINAELTEGGEN
jgi:hypothetical protein